MIPARSQSIGGLPSLWKRYGPYVAAAVLLLLGWLNLSRGLAHQGVAYRPWAFAHHSYSDLLALSGDRYLRGGRPLPYLEDRIEYPVLLGLLLWAPSFVPGGQAAYFTVSYLVLAASCFASIAVLRRTPGASPWWLAGTPALAYYGGLNWDLPVIALLLWAALAVARGRTGAGGALTALGISAKLWPAALLPAALGALARRRADDAADPRALSRGAASLCATLLAVNLPVALAAPQGFSWFFRYNARRGAENSFWASLPPLDPATLNLAGLGVLALLSAVAAAGASRRSEVDEPARSEGLRLATGLVLAGWIATNKVYSPQYALYLFAAGALAGAPFRLFWPLAAVSILDYHLAFEWRARGMDPEFARRFVYPTDWVRTAVQLALAAWIARRLYARAPRSPGQ